MEQQTTILLRKKQYTLYCDKRGLRAVKHGREYFHGSSIPSIRKKKIHLEVDIRVIRIGISNQEIVNHVMVYQGQDRI
jgi:hypothetical protein